MVPDLVDLLAKWLGAAVKRFERHCSDFVGELQETGTFHKGIHTVSAHKLGAVEQRQSLF